MKLRSSQEICRSVIFALILREMRGRFGRMRLGAFWTFMEPLAHMAVLGTIMVLRGRHSYSYDYLVFLLVGLAPFLLYKNIVTKIMNSVDANKALFAYKQIQPFDAFVARAIMEFCISALVFVVLYLGLTWYGFDTHIARPSSWVFTVFLGIFFSFALGILFAIIVEAVPEAKTALSLLFMPLYLLSGVIYPISSFPQSLAKYILWNPYLHIIELIRYDTFTGYRLYYGVSLEFVIKCTIIFSFVALFFYRVRRLRLMAR
ncbi:ABC transporter permease [Bordetella petrii]|uniref:ABC transporter permease n=1 Tax=Bordetella petrii TaxID=94624 RepID=UPI001E48E8A9|nr:ABC transporter permease [Bordetella petrii]MCD0501726.1 ABC transporter permease [Bordetella petrii]